MDFYDEERILKNIDYLDYPLAFGNGEPGYYHGQNLVLTKCLDITREENYDWVQFGDMDEFLYFEGKFDVRTFLSRFSRYSHITLGKYMYSRKYCRPKNESHPNDIFSFLYRPTSPFCAEAKDRYQETVDYDNLRNYKFCQSWYGRRKYIVQPKLIKKLHIHQISQVISKPGIDLDVN
eukprot:UN25459